MAGTVVTTEERIGAGNLHKVTFAWTSSAGGAADATTTYAYTGKLHRAHIIPGTAGDQPSDAFDVTVTDADSVDLLYGNGANCSNASTTVVKDGGSLANDTITLGVTNAGDSNKGTVILYLEVG